MKDKSQGWAVHIKSVQSMVGDRTSDLEVSHFTITSVKAGYFVAGLVEAQQSKIGRPVSIKSSNRSGWGCGGWGCGGCTLHVAPLVIVLAYVAHLDPVSRQG